MSNPTENKQPIYDRDAAIQKLKSIINDTNITMLCTRLGEAPFGACPMSTQEVEDNGTIWFFSTRDSDHNSDIRQDPRVQLIYNNTGDQEYLSIYGRAEIVEDRSKIDELWSPMVKVWFPEGKEDPNLTLIRVTPAEGYYWDTKHGKMVAFLKMAASLVTGKTMDDSVEGEIRL